MTSSRLVEDIPQLILQFAYIFSLAPNESTSRDGRPDCTASAFPLMSVWWRGFRKVILVMSQAGREPVVAVDERGVRVWARCFRLAVVACLAVVAVFVGQSDGRDLARVELEFGLASAAAARSVRLTGFGAR